MSTSDVHTRDVSKALHGAVVTLTVTLSVMGSSSLGIAPSDMAPADMVPATRNACHADMAPATAARPDAVDSV